MSNRFIPPRETGATADPTATGAFEFGDAENTIFTGLARAMKFVAIMSSLFGVLEIFNGIHIGTSLVGLLTIGQGVVLLVIGGWLGSASRSLSEIVTSQGNDIGNLMIAMERLRSVYTLQAWLMGLACVLMAIAIVVVLR